MTSAAISWVHWIAEREGSGNKEQHLTFLQGFPSYDLKESHTIIAVIRITSGREAAITAAPDYPAWYLELSEPGTLNYPEYS